MIVISFALVKSYAFAVLYVLIVMQIKLVVVVVVVSFQEQTASPCSKLSRNRRFRTKMTTKTLKWSIVLFYLLIGHYAVEKKAYGSCLERALGFTSQWTLTDQEWYDNFRLSRRIKRIILLLKNWDQSLKSKTQRCGRLLRWRGKWQCNWTLSHQLPQLSHTVNLFGFKKWKWQTLT